MEKDKKVNIDPDLHTRTKVKASKEGKSIKKYIEELILKDLDTY